MLSEEIKHHVKEEEKPGEGMFAQAREGGVDMAALGDRMKARKEQLLAKIKQSGLPPPEHAQLHGPQAAAGPSHGSCPLRNAPQRPRQGAPRQAVHLLTDAAEIELLCSYLYAAAATFQERGYLQHGLANDKVCYGLSLCAGLVPSVVEAGDSLVCLRERRACGCQSMLALHRD